MYTEDDTFKSLAKPTFESLDILFKSKFPTALVNNFTSTQIDFINSHYWSHTAFGEARRNSLIKHIHTLVAEYPILFNYSINQNGRRRNIP